VEASWDLLLDQPEIEMDHRVAAVRRDGFVKHRSESGGAELLLMLERVSRIVAVVLSPRMRMSSLRNRSLSSTNTTVDVSMA
jgi:hypothetical protein